MKIGINGRFLAEPYTGIGQYTRNLLKAIGEIDKKNTYLIVTHKKTELNFGKNFKIHVINEKPLIHSGVKKMFWEQIQLPAFFRKQKVDLIHHFYPSNSLRKIDIPEIVTVHDVIPWILPAYRKKMRTRIYQAIARKALGRARKIIAVSKDCKNDLKEYLKISEKKIKVIYNAPADSFYHKVPAAIIKKVREKYNLKRPFVLYAGGFDERKNVKTLIQVFKENIAPYFSVDLILIGKQINKSQLYKSFNLLRKTKENDINKKEYGEILGTGVVSEKELQALYQACLAFCHLSVKEGFNIPAVEAMASQTPILISDIPVHREVMGDAAIFCPPDDPGQIAEKLKKIIEDEDFRFRLKEKTKTLKNKYSWRKTAEEVKKIYKV